MLDTRDRGQGHLHRTDVRAPPGRADPQLVWSRQVAPFDQARQQVQQAMGQGGGQQLQQWLTDSLKKATVKMNPKFGKFNKTKPVPEIEAPQAPPAPPGQTPTSAPSSPLPTG